LWIHRIGIFLTVKIELKKEVKIRVCKVGLLVLRVIIINIF